MLTSLYRQQGRKRHMKKSEGQNWKDEWLNGGSKRFSYQKRPGEGCRVRTIIKYIYTQRVRERETYRCCCINCWQLDLPLSALEKSELSKTRFHKRVTVPRFMQKKKREGASFRPQLQQRRVMDPAVREEPTDNTKERHQTLLGLTFFPSVYSIFFLLRR